MRNYFRNLLAALRGRRGQSAINSVIASVQDSVEGLRQARQHLYHETYANEDQIAALAARNTELYEHASRAVRFETKLREFIS